MGFLKSAGKFALEFLESAAETNARNTKHDELRDQYSEMGNGFRTIRNNFFEDDDDDNDCYDDDDDY